MDHLEQFKFDNSYVKFPERFYERRNPTPVASPRLIKINRRLALDLGLDPDFLCSPKGVSIFAGNKVPEGAEPLAMAYAGQQFGVWVPQLGDGRAILLGEVLDKDGVRRDIQLKGSGPTAYSRSGDGRAWIGPVLREYVISEAMHALNIPTTRALAAVTTGEMIFREQPLPGAVITRVAKSHIRVGTFQFFSSRQDYEALQMLADYVIDRHYPEARKTENPYLSLLESVTKNQAALIAKWMGVGFIHGVMNTDNMSISGETIDYGPCAFMDGYNPDMVFSSIDRHGRYAFQNQPEIAHWNLASLGSSLLPLINSDEKRAIELASNTIDAFNQKFHYSWSSIFRKKIGLEEEVKEDTALISELLTLMAGSNADFTITFRRLSKLSSSVNGSTENMDTVFTELFEDKESIINWLTRWRNRLLQENTEDRSRCSKMCASNPAYIPRNHRVEQIIEAATDGDYEPFEKLMDVLLHPFDDQPGNEMYLKPPQPHEVVHETFCGT